MENGRRRGEMALYVLPRALRACLPDTWVKSGNRGIKVVERYDYFAIHQSLLFGSMCFLEQHRFHPIHVDIVDSGHSST